MYLPGYSQIDSSLVDTLDSLVVEDQKYRTLFRKVSNGELDSVSLEYISNSIRVVDSINYQLISKLFEIHGYLGFDKVGETGSHNFWLLVQHQDKHPEFQMRVLNEMKKSAEQANASFTDYAYLIDRVNVNLGKLQVYGTQLVLNQERESYEVKPVMDPEKLNDRRSQAGLPPIEFYIKAMNERFFGTLKK